MVRRGYNTFYYKHLLQKKESESFSELGMGQITIACCTAKKMVGSYWTVTVPTKKGCSVQKYVYSPGSVGIVTGLLS
jgi:hypothetical protein